MFYIEYKISKIKLAFFERASEVGYTLFLSEKNGRRLEEFESQTMEFFSVSF